MRNDYPTLWIFFKSIIAYTFYITAQLAQPFLPIYLWWMSGMFYYLVAVQAMHEVAHGTLSNHWWTLLANVGIGGINWQAKHLKHHRETNYLTDPEVNVSSLFRLHPTQVRKWYHRWQHLYAWPIYSLLHLSIWTDAILGTPNPWRGASYPNEQKTKLIRPMLFTFLHVVWPYYITGCWYAFVYELIMWTGPSLLVTICFQASHVMETILTQDCGQWDAVAWCADNTWVTELTGGLNLQPYHHKYPSLPHSMLPAVRSRSVERAPEVVTFADAIREHYQALKILGN